MPRLVGSLSLSSSYSDSGPLGSRSPMHYFCQSTYDTDFCVTILNGRYYSYSTLHGSPAPRTGLQKFNGWMDGMDGVGASPGSVCVK